ncbi:MAG TPA: hypothetical protein VKS81_09405 [Bacteroidota bacterium]|nr:hypothetical protein [Bacteroidota bacterium]
MSAIDTFNWLIKDVFPEPDEPANNLIRSKRSYLLNLRSEDERQRFVNELTVQLKTPGTFPPSERKNS